MREGEARACPRTIGLLRFLVASDHSAAGMPAGGCRGAAIECVIPLHPRATGVTDLRDHAVWLMKRRRRHCLGGGCDGQSKRNSDEPNHCFLQFVPSWEKTPSRCGRLDASARLAHAREGELQREQPASSARRGDYRRGMGCSHKLARSPSKNWSKLLTRSPILGKRGSIMRRSFRRTCHLRLSDKSAAESSSAEPDPGGVTTAPRFRWPSRTRLRLS